MASTGRPRDPNSMRSRIEAFVNGRSKETTPADVAEAFPEANAPSALLSNLARAKRIGKGEKRGTYKAVAA
jgi:hypothetical protein